MVAIAKSRVLPIMDPDQSLHESDCGANAIVNLRVGTDQKRMQMSGKSQLTYPPSCLFFSTYWCGGLSSAVHKGKKKDPRKGMAIIVIILFRGRYVSVDVLCDVCLRGQLCVCVETRETVEVGSLGGTLPEERGSTETVLPEEHGANACVNNAKRRNGRNQGNG